MTYNEIKNWISLEYEDKRNPQFISEVDFLRVSLDEWLMTISRRPHPYEKMDELFQILPIKSIVSMDNALNIISEFEDGTANPDGDEEDFIFYSTADKCCDEEYLNICIFTERTKDKYHYERISNTEFRFVITREDWYLYKDLTLQEDDQEYFYIENANGENIYFGHDTFIITEDIIIVECDEEHGRFTTYNKDYIPYEDVFHGKLFL